ncbi:nitrate reductase cytochrome c-type subunit [Marinimicrobium sp. ABcell2]|uniref:nitrate reductase cytochrome c-type subunit n=1 Tax=Marinimicrobium sp. ABcell2 TaxID=3069751 RepID=UPI0027B822EB|nr:nitrate reductase cytochrome c-type subunit [Marinimicrobium sp. ABcell2]MDQ2076725.1 nitrate reductase cytochrome c-type subunit [Marinimicrobium sp. ABcell2]
MRILPFLLLLLPLTLLAETPQTPMVEDESQRPLDAPAPDGIRRGGTLSQEYQAPNITDPRTELTRRARNFPQQPPVIPHAIRGLQVDKNVNQCLDCHSRSATHISGAPMVSITHFTDRDGQDLAAVSPRRYFCVKCHVPQDNTRPVKISTFRSIDQVLERAIQLGE